MTSSPSDPWGVPSPQPDDQWSVPPAAQPTPPEPWDAPHVAGASAVPPDPPTQPQPYTTPGQPTSAQPQPYTTPGQPTSAQPQPYNTPGQAQLTPAYGVQQPGPVIVQIAEISVTSTTIFTPTGDIPLAGSQWQVNDYWFAQQRIPKYAIVLAIVGFCILTVFSLLFLLIKETVMQGTVQVTVTNGTRQYVARIPVTDQNAVTTINQQVNYVRTLAAL